MSYVPWGKTSRQARRNFIFFFHFFFLFIVDVTTCQTILHIHMFNVQWVVVACLKALHIYLVFHFKTKWKCKKLFSHKKHLIEQYPIKHVYMLIIYRTMCFFYKTTALETQDRCLLVAVHREWNNFKIYRVYRKVMLLPWVKTWHFSNNFLLTQ